MLKKNFVIDNELLVGKLKKQKRNKFNIELELFYIETPVKDKKNKKPFFPQICIMADQASGTIVSKHMLDIDDIQSDIVIDMLIKYITKYGKPCTLIIRDENIEGYISDLCSKTGVKVVKRRKLKVIDNFVESMMGFIG